MGHSSSLLERLHHSLLERLHHSSTLLDRLHHSSSLLERLHQAQERRPQLARKQEQERRQVLARRVERERSAADSDENYYQCWSSRHHASAIGDPKVKTTFEQSPTIF